MEKKKHGIEKEDASHREKGLKDNSALTDSEAVEGAGMKTGDNVSEGAAAAAHEEPGDRVKSLEEALAQKEAEAAANWDKFVRERADLENLRKRMQREKEDLLKYGNESLLLEILPVIDNMERALAHTNEDSLASVIEGVNLTLTMLVSVLKKFGVTPIEARGKMFDPAYHQAMTQAESADHAPNTVIDEFQKGYMLNDRLLRAALVSVATAPKKVDA